MREIYKKCQRCGEASEDLRVSGKDYPSTNGACSVRIVECKTCFLKPLKIHSKPPRIHQSTAEEWEKLPRANQ